MPAPIMDVFFWALVATTSLYVGMAIFTSRQRFSRQVYMATGMLASLGYAGPRMLIPFLPQPEIGIPDRAAWLIGGAVLAAGLAIIARAIMRLRAIGKEPENGPGPVLDDGLYGLVRHPMYLGDVLWSLGLAIMLNAAYALALMPLWWLLRACLTVLEEERLVDKYGDAYHAYRARVPGRIVPALGRRRS